MTPNTQSLVDETTPEVLTPEAMVEQLRAFRRQIPDYVQLTRTEATFMVRAANVDPLFVQTTINAVGASSLMEGALGRPAAELRQEAEDVGRWSAVEDELKALLKGVQAANLTRRHRVGITALQAYSISQQLVRRSENADLLPHVAEMKRTNRFGRRTPAAVKAKRKAEAEAKAKAEAEAKGKDPVQTPAPAPVTPKPNVTPATIA